MLTINTFSNFRTMAAALALTLAWPLPAFALKAQAPSENGGLEELAVSLRADAGLEEPTKPAGDAGGSLGGPQTRREFMKTLSVLARLGVRLGALAETLAPPLSPEPPAWASYQEALPLAFDELGLAAGESRDLISDLMLSRETKKAGIVFEPSRAGQNLSASLFLSPEDALPEVTEHAQWAETFQQRLAQPNDRTALIQQLRERVRAEIIALESSRIQRSYKETMGREGWPLPEYRILATMLGTLTEPQIAEGLRWAAAQHLRDVQLAIDALVAAASRGGAAQATSRPPSPYIIAQALERFRVVPVPEFRRLEGSVVGFYVEREGLRFALPLARAITQAPAGVAALAGVVATEFDKAMLVELLEETPAAQSLLSEGLVTREEFSRGQQARDEAFRRLRARGMTFSHMVTDAHNDDPVTHLQRLFFQFGVTLPPHRQDPHRFDPAARAAALTLLHAAPPLTTGLEEPTGKGQTRREFLKTLSALVQLGARLGALADALSPPATSPSVPAWEPYRELLRDVASATTINPVADAEWFTESQTQWLVSMNDDASEWKLDERTLQELAATRRLLQRGDEDARAFQEKVATADGRTALIQEVRQLWNPEVPADWMRAMDAKGAFVGSALRTFFTRAELRNAGRSRKLAAMLEALTDEQVADGLAWATAERLRIVQGRIEPWTASFKRLLGSDWADALRRYESEHSQFAQAPQRAAPRSGDAPQGTPSRKSTEARPDQRTTSVAQKSPVGPEDSGIPGFLLARMPQPDTGESFETWLRRIHTLQGPGLVSPVEETARRLRTLLWNYHFAQQAALWDAFVMALPSVRENPYQTAWLTSVLEVLATLHELQGPPAEAPIQQALTFLHAAPPLTTGLEEPTPPAPWDQPMDRRAFLKRSGKTLAMLSRAGHAIEGLLNRLPVATAPTASPPAWKAFRTTLREAVREGIFQDEEPSSLVQFAIRVGKPFHPYRTPDETTEVSLDQGCLDGCYDVLGMSASIHERGQQIMEELTAEESAASQIQEIEQRLTTIEGVKHWLERRETSADRTSSIATAMAQAQQSQIPDDQLSYLASAARQRLRLGQRITTLYQELPTPQMVEGLRWAVGEYLRETLLAVRRMESYIATLQELSMLIHAEPATSLTVRPPVPSGIPDYHLLPSSSRGTVRQPISEFLQRLRARGITITPDQAEGVLNAQVAGAGEVLLVPLAPPPTEAAERTLILLCASGALRSLLADTIQPWAGETPTQFVVRAPPTEGSPPRPAGEVPAPLAVAVRLTDQPRVAGVPNLVVESPEALSRLTPGLIAAVAQREAGLADQDLPVVAALPLTVDGREVLALFL